MRIAIGCSSLCISRGGTERAAVQLAVAMHQRGHSVLLLSLSNSGRTVPVYPLVPGIRHLAWSPKGKHQDIVLLREFIVADNIDIFLSMQSSGDHLFWSMACMGSGVPFICSERCDPSYIEKFFWNHYGRIAVLSGADCIHELLPIYVSSVPEIYHSKIRVIPNAAPFLSVQADTVGDSDKRKTLLYLARFHEQKRPELLLAAFRLIFAKYPDWDLVMWGHGPQAGLVHRRVRQWGLSNRVFLPGICKDSASAYASAHIYCLPSYYEGFPNTVLEAMSAGLPVVAFSECDGVRDVLEHGRTGLLVENSTPEALAQALSTLMDDAPLRYTMGKAGKVAIDDYEPSRIYDQWESLFEEMAQRKGHTVMDSFSREPFASKARLSAAARREWLYRDFGDPMPYTSTWFWQRGKLLCARLLSSARQRIRILSRRSQSCGEL